MSKTKDKVIDDLNTAGTMQEEYDRQQANKTDNEKFIDLLVLALDTIHNKECDEEIKKMTLDFLQRVPISVVKKGTYGVSESTLGNISPIRKWFVGHGYNSNGMYYKPLETVNDPDDDRVNHPPHYTWLKDLCGIEVIDITRHMDFCLGNAVKYILRAGHKSEEGMNSREKEIEDLKKAIFYLNDKIKMLEL